MKTRPTRRGVTILEVLIGAAILSLLSLGIFRVFRGTNRAAAQAAWYTAAEAQARFVLQSLQDDLARAACRSTVREDGVEREECTAGIREGELTLTDGGGETPLFNFPACKPEVQVPGSEDGGGCTEVVVRAFGRSIHYYRQSETEPGRNIDRDVCADVAAIRIDVRDAAGENATEGKMVDIELELTHPNPGLFPEARVLQRTSARVAIPVGAP